MDNRKLAARLVSIAKSMTSEQDEGMLTQRLDELMSSKDKLAKAIQSEFGYKPKFKSPKETGRGRIEFVDDGLEDDVGIMGLTIAKLSLEVAFNADRLLEDGSIWGQVHLWWKHKSGGSNGADLGTIWFKANDRFVIRSSAL